MSLYREGPQAAHPKHVLLVSTALLRLLRAEVIRLRNQNDAVESRLRRVNFRADSAANEIALLEEDVSSLQERDSASSDIIRSLRQQIVALEERLTDREAKLSEKEDELLTARHSVRSLASTCAGTAALSASCGHSSSPESDDDSDTDSAYDTSRLSEAESLLRGERAAREALEVQVSDAASSAELLRQELCDARLEFAGLEERALVFEADRSQAMVSAADAEDARRTAETVAANAKAELLVVMARVGSAAAQVESLRCVISEANHRHESTAKRLHAERLNVEEAHREQMEQRHHEIIDLQQRLKALELEQGRSLTGARSARASPRASPVGSPRSVRTSPQVFPFARLAVPAPRRHGSEAHVLLGPALSEKCLARKAIPTAPTSARNPRVHAAVHSPDSARA